MTRGNSGETQGRVFLSVFVVALGMILLPASSPAQSTALLTGTVVDPSGGVMTEAQVVCRNTQTGLTYTTTTNAEGLFRFPSLPIGDYEVTVSHPGFEKLVRRGLQLLTGHSVDLHLELQVGASVQSVEVTSAAPVVQPTSSVVQTTVASREIRQLPLNGRNPLQLVTLTPGTFLSTTGTEGNQQENQGVTTNGLRAPDNNYVLDGMEYINREWDGPPTLPNPDALQEFTMKSSNFSASLSGPGATMLLSTRSGTNQFHGSVYEFLRNDATDSRNFFSTSVSPYKQNQFGATFGGPLKKDKMFVFFSYQATRQIGSSSPSTITAPTAAERNGDYSKSKRIIVNPATGQPFPNNMIPQGSFDALAVKLYQPLVPLPTLSNGLAVLVPNNKTNDDQGLFRFDYNLSPKDHLSVRYFGDEYDFRRLTDPFPSIYAQNNYLDQSLLVSDTHSFSPNLLFVGSFAFTRTARTQVPTLPESLQSLGQKAPLALGSAAESIDLSISNYFSIFSGGPLIGLPNVFGFNGETTWIHGKHLLQFGMYVERDWMYSADQSFSAGVDSFNGSRTSSPTVANSGDSFADFLLGLPSEFVQDARTPQNFRGTQWAPWVQDDWKVSRNLTLNLGLRWEPWLPPYDLLGPAAGFEPGAQSQVAPLAPVGIVFTGDPGLRQSIWPTDWKSFAPRAGFAWDVQGNGKTVVRSAFGIFNLTVPLNMIRTSNSGSAFRSAAVDILAPPSFADPYQNYPGGDPYPFTEPPNSALKTYKFPNPLVTTVLDPNSTQGYAEEWNLTVERQFRPNLGLSVSYVGNHQLGVMATYQANPAVYGPGATEANVQSRRLYPLFGALADASSSWEHGNYNGLQVSVTNHFQHGLTVLANYTYAKCMDNDSGGTIGADAGGGDAFNDKFNLNDGFGRCDFDHTNSSNVSLVYNLPQENRLKGFAGKLVNGWQATSIITARTGGPFTVSTGVDQSRTGQPNSDTADQISADTARPAGANQLQEWFNTAAFVKNTLGQFGNVGRNSLFGPGAWNVDSGFVKITPITERIQSEFRVEMFNLFNHPNFNNPNSTETSAQFGQIRGASSPRVLQFVMKLTF
ncbi:MAG: carboxypeptidase regulatory-like domain-containing protein [Terriglobia bacterium]